MGLYDEQIRQRIKADNAGFTRSFAELAGSVMGSAPLTDFDNSALAQNAIELVLKHYKAKLTEIPKNITDFNGQLEYSLNRAGLLKRRVKLTKGWERDAFGAMLGSLTDGTVIALIPGKAGGYTYHDYKTGQSVKVTAKTEINEDAYCFYRPLPARPITIRDFLVYLLSVVRVKDFVWLGMTSLAATLVGLVSPYMTGQLFGNVINAGDVSVLFAAAAVLVSATVSSALIQMVSGMATEHVGQKATVTVGAAMYMRILSLSPKFFKDKPAGEIASRAGQAEALCQLITVGLVVSLFTALFSLVYIGQIFAFAPGLTVPALLIMLATLVLSAVSMFVSMKYNHELMENQAKESGITMSLFSGVQKIKLAGAEKRAFAKWSSFYVKRAKMQYMPPVFIRFGQLFSLLITSAGTLLFYWQAVANDLTVAEYMMFNAAFGLASGAFMQLMGVASTFTSIKTILKTLSPIFAEQPETSEGGLIINRLSGGVELNNISFRYADNMPLILDNLSLKIRPGQYVAIVGATGCGKSTLMRLMLGFETPQKGAVYYDGKDLAKLDKKAFRKFGVGVVLQNGSLFAGDIYSNIVISAPWLTQQEAWEAAEIAGIADDIRAMPMGMHTMISEGQGGVSGGQKQRLMIARAVAGKPKILMLDEATAALDNITQKHVSESLAKLKCTRIVIAHRLSTIKECDRIIMLENGGIVEDGTYEELIAVGGKFADLVERQRLDGLSLKTP